MPPRKYRKPRFRSFRPGLAARAPGLMLIIGLVLSAGTHAGLGYVMQDRTLGKFDPSLLMDDDTPVRVKRATFDQITGAANDEGEGTQEPDETAESLAETLMRDVETASSEVFDPELELREVPEPLPRTEAVAQPSTQDVFDFGDLLSDMVIEPEEIAYDDTSAFDAQRSVGAGSAALSGDLLAQLSAADGGLPDLAAGTGDGLGASGAAAASAAGPGVGPGVGPGAGGGSAGSSAASGAAVGDGLGLDFMGFGAIDPQDFEPPERLDDDFDYRITRLDSPTEAGYFQVKITGKRSLRKLATMPKDVVFMVDTSRSIPQKTIEQITDGIKQSIRTMNDDDRFNLVFFSDQVRTFAGDPVPTTRENLTMADRWMRNVRARGQTDVNLALRQLLKRDIEPGRVYELILISDGNPTMGVLDTRELINLITRENDLAASIYCVGIGRDQDNRLLDFLAYRNKGFSVSIERRADVTLELVELMSRLRYPIIHDVQVRFAGQGMDQIYPLTLPNIHQGESFEVYGRFDQPGPFTVQVTGQSAGKPVDLTFRADLNDAPAGTNEVAQGWAFWKLHHLYSEIIRLSERPDLLTEIRKLRSKYQLQTLY
ncbi:VWA domain-containing protein [Algisphaera agarilytica]|uniref:Mg-chelatase subunit ChlD n=1 Tax=Algisphaera agarilytica TaxID=1385975 RepID=A0A7X0LKL3_9BACT|nr:VWA domain-containing protein [Algisphaera agarilytica]MBB6429078.1 Mg-chelatase subunit ChlD [Algisphaera agarilytica]